MPKLRGFSMLELMAVVAIIGILVAMAIPSYQQYLKRARFTEIITTAEGFKLAVALAIQEGSERRELSNGEHGIPLAPPSTRTLARLAVENGVITAIGTALVDKLSYRLTPNEDGSEWLVDGSCVQAGLCHVG